MSISTTEQAVSAYKEVLSRIEQATERLLLAIKDWDSHEVDRLIESRRALCAEIGPRMTELFNALGQNGLSDSQHADIIVELETRHAILSGKQAACESLLTQSMQECRQEMLSLNQRKHLPNAYLRRPIVQQSRFLDNRF